MGLSRLISADGSPLSDADGNPIYVYTPSAPHPSRLVRIASENRITIVREQRVVKIAAETRVMRVRGY